MDVPSSLGPIVEGRPRTVHPARRDLRASVLEGVGFSVMVGLGEVYLGAFGLALGLGEITAGLLASVPMIAGGALQLASPRLVHRLGSSRRFVVLSATAQALAFLPLVVGALLGAMPASLAFLAVTLYYGAGLASSPAWNAWIETLVPRRSRARYFAHRTRVLQGATLAALLVGGLVLHVGHARGWHLEAFAVLFTLACLARLSSSRLLARHREPLPPAPHRGPSTLEAARRLLHGPEGRVIGYLVLVQLAVQISAPYFSPYLLGHLGLSYGELVALTATSMVAKMIAAPFFGDLAARLGARRLLQLGGVAIVPIAALVLVSSSMPWLVVSQIASGVAWAAYELGSFLILFETIDREERTAFLTVHNFASAAATAIGSLLGAGLARAVAEPHTAYVVLFLASSTARLLTATLVLRAPRAALACEPTRRAPALHTADVEADGRAA